MVSLFKLLMFFMYLYPYSVFKFKTNIELFFYPIIKNGFAYLSYTGYDIKGYFFNTYLYVKSYINIC